MQTENYLDIARQGKNDWWRYLLGIIVILFFWFGLGTVFILVPVMWGMVNTISTGTINPENMFPGVPPLIVVSFVLLSFVPIIAGVLLTIRFLHKRSYQGLITAQKTINWRRVAQGALIYGFLIAIAALAEAMLYPGRYQFSLNLTQFIPFLLLGLILIPIQTTAEELVFRGYLLQGFSHLTRNPFILSFISGFVFMLPHLANPEIEVGPELMAANFFIVGFALAFISLRDNGLELAIGIHAANNLFALVAIYPNSALPVESIFTIGLLDPTFSLISVIIIYLLFYLIVFGKNPGKKMEAPQSAQT